MGRSVGASTALQSANMDDFGYAIHADEFLVPKKNLRSCRAPLPGWCDRIGGISSLPCGHQRWKLKSFMVGYLGEGVQWAFSTPAS